MSSIASEFDRFLTYLASRQQPDDVLRMANLVRANLTTLAPVGAMRRARSMRLAPLAIQQLAQTPIQAPNPGAAATAAQGPQRLSRLVVGPFRGFMRQEVFNFSGDVTLIEGANGTGKSSFFEALEAALLGSISEAQAKRIDHRQYCNNVRLRRHDVPQIWSTHNGQEQLLAADEEHFRFCFIEKNRLDDFARIAARTAGDQRHLIATLFGVDQFADFVRGFNTTLDEDLALNNGKAIELAARRQQVAASQQYLDGYQSRLDGFAQQEATLAQQCRPGRTFDECRAEILGTEAVEGRLTVVQRLLDRPTATVYGATVARMDEAVQARMTQLQALFNARAALQARAADVSFSQLYQAVIAVAQNAQTCPACDTPIDRVVQHPFTKARAGLEALAELAALQQAQATAQQAFDTADQDLFTVMKRCVNSATLLFGQEFHAAQLPNLPDRPVNGWLDAWSQLNWAPWHALVPFIRRVEVVDAQTQQASLERAALVTERTILDGWRTHFEQMRTLRESAHTEWAAARQRIAAFENDNQALINESVLEVGIILEHQRIKQAYDGFLRELTSYLNNLPQTLLRGLGEQARNLYNLFNRDDPPGDLLESLNFPVTENQRLQISYVGEPGVFHDALQILSEGHIKCLGLAILLAKNLERNDPFVIFDDVVNAIDDDHRNGILRTFFENDLMQGKQIILTSHAEEFLQRIQQQIGAARARGLVRYKFLHHNGEHELRIDTNPPSKNYVVLARAAFDRDEKRDALRAARTAVESLTDRLWNKLGRYTSAPIELKFAGPKAHFELNNKCTKLRQQIGRVPNAPIPLQACAGALDQLLGLGGQCLEWQYLNAGTHDSDRRAEFDRASVQTIIVATEQLDQALAALQN